MDPWATSNTTTRASSSWQEDGPEDHDLESCPDASRLAAFCEGHLDKLGQQSISRHLLRCRRCYFAFTESARLSDAEESESPAQLQNLWRQLTEPAPHVNGSDVEAEMRRTVVYAQVASRSAFLDEVRRALRDDGRPRGLNLTSSFRAIESAHSSIRPAPRSGGIRNLFRLLWHPTRWRLRRS